VSRVHTYKDIQYDAHSRLQDRVGIKGGNDEPMVTFERIKTHVSRNGRKKLTGLTKRGCRIGNTQPSDSEWWKQRTKKSALLSG